MFVKKRKKTALRRTRPEVDGKFLGWSRLVWGSTKSIRPKELEDVVMHLNVLTKQE